MAYRFDCRFFTGYKPCTYKRPCGGCPHYTPVQSRILIISLEALGAVLRSTCLLQPVRRQHPGAHISWLTLPSAEALLRGNPEIDRLLLVNAATTAVLEHLEFDVLYCVDKSLEAGALAERIKARRKYGFGLSPTGVIRPLSPEADYQYDVGLSDELKFFRNQKAETQQITETMGLAWQRDDYLLRLSDEEKATVAKRRTEILQGARGIIGYNTGCSTLYPFKKLTVERSIEVIAAWRQAFPQHVVALLGGREDSERQAAMKQAFAHDPLVYNTPTSEGLRAGILWMAASDMVFSGCSLGMHIAIGLKKPVIAWFGVSCIQEVDLYERGEKIQSPVSCSPCWKKTCQNEPKCFNQVTAEMVTQATARVMRQHGL